MNVATQLLFPTALTPTKLSILCLYYRIFPYRRFKNAAIAVGVLNILWFIIFMCVNITACRPVQYFWDKSIPNGTCLDLYAELIATSTATFVTDMLVLLLPIPWLWGVQMKTTLKLAVIGMFLLGGL